MYLRTLPTILFYVIDRIQEQKGKNKQLGKDVAPGQLSLTIYALGAILYVFLKKLFVGNKLDHVSPIILATMVVTFNKMFAPLSNIQSKRGDC